MVPTKSDAENNTEGPQKQGVYDIERISCPLAVRIITVHSTQAKFSSHSTFWCSAFQIEPGHDSSL